MPTDVSVDDSRIDPVEASTTFTMVCVLINASDGSIAASSERVEVIVALQ